MKKGKKKEGDAMLTTEMQKNKGFGFLFE